MWYYAEREWSIVCTFIDSYYTIILLHSLFFLNSNQTTTYVLLSVVCFAAASFFYYYHYYYFNTHVSSLFIFLMVHLFDILTIIGDYYWDLSHAFMISRENLNLMKTWFTKFKFQKTVNFLNSILNLIKKFKI